MKKTVLIVGASSFVGSNLALYLKDHFRVIGTYHKTPMEIPGVTCYPCDVFKKDYVSSLIGVLKPDYTIYAVGMSSLTECKLNPKQADALNWKSFKHFKVDLIACVVIVDRTQLIQGHNSLFRHI